MNTSTLDRGKPVGDAANTRADKPGAPTSAIARAVSVSHLNGARWRAVCAPGDENMASFSLSVCLIVGTLRLWCRACRGASVASCALAHGGDERNLSSPSGSRSEPSLEWKRGTHRLCKTLSRAADRSDVISETARCLESAIHSSLS